METRRCVLSLALWAVSFTMAAAAPTDMDTVSRHHLDIKEGTFLHEVFVEGTSGKMEPLGTTIDRSQNVYVCGKVTFNADEGKDFGTALDNNEHGKEDVFLMKISKGGDRLWTGTIGSAESDSCQAVSVWENSVYIIGTTCGVVEAGHGNNPPATTPKAGDILLGKVSTEGKLIWLHQHSRDSIDAGWDIHAEKNVLHIVGITNGELFTPNANGDSRVFLGELGVDGQHGSMKGEEFDLRNRGDTSVEPRAVMFSPAADKGKHSFLVTSEIRDDHLTGSVLKIVTKSRKLVWQYTFKDDATLTPTGLVPLRDGGVAISGIYYRENLGNATSADEGADDNEEDGVEELTDPRDMFFVAKLSSKGAVQWQKVNGVDKSDDHTRGVYLLEKDRLLVLGETNGALGSKNMRGELAPVALVYNSDGEVIMRYQMAMAPNQVLQVRLATFSPEAESVFMIEGIPSETAIGGVDLALGTFGKPSVSSLDYAEKHGGNYTGLLDRLMGFLPTKLLMLCIILALFLAGFMTLLVIRRARARRNAVPLGDDLVYQDSYDDEEDSESHSGQQRHVKSTGGVVRIPKGYIEPESGPS